jgi:cytochrome c oxidase assembly protein subunit 15
MMGRSVGYFFAGGCAYFTFIHKPKPFAQSLSTMAMSVLPSNINSAIPPGYQSRLAFLFAMGGTQGLVGWWMVKSGLGDNRRGDQNEIRVSPYRLAAHLGMAIGTYTMLLWTGLGVLSYPIDAYAASSSGRIPTAASVAGVQVSTKECTMSMLQQYAKNLTPEALRHARSTRVGVISTVGLTGLTILSGAFVAGNDAGNAYNTYPLMDGQWIPLEDMIDPAKEPIWRNAFETTAMVQWNHRVLGTATALSALGVAGYGLLASKYGMGGMPGSITPQVQRGLMALGAAATGQMSLGIATLLNYVPITLAASHQLGSLVVLTGGVYAAHSLRYAGMDVVSKVGSGAIQSLVGSGGGGGAGGVMQKGSTVLARVSNVKI